MAQVVQHNIMALNSYNKLSSNNSLLSKNLEKLSSGYKINRAGDDAAGLAISEKMRAQITGLERAATNAQDGISLVQTAEGALTEVHSMLNRMTELATQAANGTYDNDVDRANLQKEVDSLLEEIDRISDETNFNGIKLLDGSMGSVASTSEITEVPETSIPVNSPVGEDVAASYTFEIKEAFASSDTINIGDKTIKFVDTDAGSAADELGVDKYATTDDQAAAIAEMLKTDDYFGADAYDITVEGKKITLTAKTAGADANRDDIRFATSKGSKLTVTENVQGLDKGTAADDATHAEYKITLNAALADGKTFEYAGFSISAKNSGATANDINVGTSGALTVEAQAKSIADIMNNDSNFSENYHVRAEGNDIIITAKNAGPDKKATLMSTKPTGDADTKISVTEGTEVGVVSKPEAAKATYTLKLSQLDKDKTFTFNGVTITAVDNGNGSDYTKIKAGDTAATQAKTIAGLMAADKTNFGDYKITVNDDTITFEKLSVGVDDNKGNMVAGGTDAAKVTAVNTVEGKGELDESEGVKAEYVIDLGGNLAANDQVTIGDRTFTFKANADVKDKKNDINVATNNTKALQAAEIKKRLEEDTDFASKYKITLDADNRIYISAREIGEDDLTLKVNDAALKGEVTTITEGVDAAEDLGKTNIQLDFSGAGYKSALGNKFDVNGKTYEFVKYGQAATDKNAVAVELNEDFTDADMANALANAIKKNDTDVEVGISKDDPTKVIISKKNSANEKENLHVDLGGKGLGLQIGDTKSQRITVKVDDMGTRNLGLSGLKIDTEEDATDAVAVIKAAINQVSVTRADLGAIQNRLEHTITNLETTTENLTNAESRIRDTDMAKEMMAYTKNNVLSQAAQAMLAQANQQPQQVLQLLQ